MKRWICFFALLMLIPICICAQCIIFENTGVPISVRDSLKIIQMANYENSFYSQVGITDSVHIRLRTFKSENSFIAYLKSHSKDNISYLSGGLFNGQSEEMWIPKSSSYLPVVYHELSHYFFQKQFRRSPGWLNEGLAKYFEYTKIKGNKVSHPLSESEARYIKSMLEMKEIELKKLITISGKDVARKSLTNDGFIHKVGYGIVFMFIEKHAAEFTELLKKIKNGADSFDAIQETYPGGFAQFENDFNAYYMNNRLF